MKRSRLGGYALACALVVSACSSTPGSSPAASSGGGGSSSAPAASSGGGTSFPAVLPLRFGTIPGANHLPNYLAIKNAAKYGLDIKDNQFTKPADNLTALITGQIDVADQTPSTAIVAQDQNLPVVMIAGDARGSTQIVISKNLGVAEGDWAGLQAAASKAAAAGKKLKFGASVGPSSNYIECYFELKLKGVDPATQLEVVNIPAFPDMAAALRAGSADMLCAPQPYATQAKTTGNGMLFAAPFDTEAGNALGAVTSTTDTLKDPLKREAIRRFVQAMSDAMKQLASDPQVVLQEAMSVLKTNDEAFAKQAMEGVSFDIGLDKEKVAALAKYHFELQQTKKDWSTDLKWLDDSILAGIQQ